MRSAPFFPLCEKRIRAALPTSLSSLSVHIYESIDSTNTEARRLLCRGLTLPALIVAHTQTAGRGRLGRSFHSPIGTGLYMTVVFDLSGALDDIAAVTPMAAVATAQAIEEICGKSPDIKWVNDLYLQGRKVCGVLTEAVAFSGGYHIIVGIGINLTTREFPEGMRHPAGALLSETDPPVDASLLCAEVTKNLFFYLNPQNAAACLAAYRAHLTFVGQAVVCSRHFSEKNGADETKIQGTVEGVDDAYGLILRLEDGSRTVLRGGEISLECKSYKEDP